MVEYHQEQEPSLEHRIGIATPCEEARGPKAVRIANQLTLMSLPPEIRNMIWWATLAPEGGFVPIVHRHLDRPRVGVPERDARFHPNPVAVQKPPRLLHTVTYQRQDEHRNGEAGWALVRVNKEVREEAEGEYWRRAICDGLMVSFTCHHFQLTYYGVLAAWAFFNDCSDQYLQAIRRVHLDLRRTGYYDMGYARRVMAQERHLSGLTNCAEFLDPLLDLMGTRLIGLRHLSLTFSGWVPDVRQTPVCSFKRPYTYYLAWLLLVLTSTYVCSVGRGGPISGCARGWP
jgi:hypothetical protein